jgi:hypothetical protein
MLENVDLVMGIAPWLLGLLLGVGGGAAKHITTDVPIAEKQRKLQGATTRYSPWTGMRAPEPSQPNLFGNILQGGVTGAQLGLSADKAGLFDSKPPVAGGGGANSWGAMGSAEGAPAGGGRIMPNLMSRRGINPWGEDFN